MKAIMLSVKPQWLAKILNGDKTVEIRKTIPKCNLPIDVYLYCTKGKPYLTKIDNEWYLTKYGCIKSPNGYVKMENGKVVAKFTLNKYTDMMKWAYSYKDNEFYELLKKACIDTYDLTNYAGNKAKRLYAWEIDNLVIFDTPKELKDFYVERYAVMPNGIFPCNEPLAKSPQSWQFIEVAK